jgi:hypothetical protein
MVLGCQMSDPPATSEIAAFSSGPDIAPPFGLFTYGAPLQPMYTISAGMVNVTDTIEIGATAQEQGFGIYLNGNAAGRLRGRQQVHRRLVLAQRITHGDRLRHAARYQR